MSVRVVPIAKETNWQGLRHCSTAPDLQFIEARTPRRRQSVAELRIPKRKESITFFASPHRTRKNVTWRATATPTPNRNRRPPKPPLNPTFLRNLRGELDAKDQTKVTPRQPRRQNGMVRLTPTPNNGRRKEILVLPRLSRPLV